MKVFGAVLYFVAALLLILLALIPKTSYILIFSIFVAIFFGTLFYFGGRRKRAAEEASVIIASTAEPSPPQTLLSVAGEAEAVGIINALADYGVQATMTGGFTSGFKALSPGDVQITVRTSDYDKAQLALAKIQSGDDKVDWNSVDVGTPEE